MIKTTAFAAAVVGTVAAAHAETLTAIHNESVDFGPTHGSVYYVEGRDGYHLVATLSSGGESTPVRFDTVLADGQSATVSVPGPVGTKPDWVTFTRTADHVVVRRSNEARSVSTQ